MPSLVLLVALCLPGAAAAEPPAGDQSYLVVYADGVRRAASHTDTLESRVDFAARHRFSRALKGFSARLSAAQVAELRADPAVTAVTPDRPVTAQAVDLVTGELLPPGIRRVGATAATQVHGASPVGVAVLDTGIDLDHPDLNVSAGKNCMGSSAPDDGNGHGTHVAGTIGAKNNGLGVVGVAPGTQLHAVKVLNDSGSGTTSSVLCGIDWVLANAARLGIRVVNLSLGGLGDRSTCANSAEHDAYCRLTEAGITVVVAAGNDGWDLGTSPPDVPASYPEVLTVTAMADTDGVAGGSGPSACGASDDRFAWFSNYVTLAEDAAHTIAAPGVCIRSTYPGGGTSTMSGTSMATPHVAGAVALCLAEGAIPGPCHGKTPAEIITLMRETAAAAPGNGFTADLVHPGRLFGPLVALPVDVTAPETVLDQVPAAVSTTGTADFGFSASEAATFECSVDGADWTACTSPLQRTELADGAHTFSVRATDLTGNTDASPATHAWTVEPPAPASDPPAVSDPEPASDPPAVSDPAPAPDPVPAPTAQPTTDPTTAARPATDDAPAILEPVVPVLVVTPWFRMGAISVYALAGNQPAAGISLGNRRALLGSVAAKARTRIDARLVMGPARSPRALGRLRVTLRRGQAGALWIPLSRAGRRLLSGRTSVAARLIFVTITPSGRRSTRHAVRLAVG